ncbi:MAG: sugar ABC transporter ATP-binding protein [Ignavibacteriales bacterium]|nr:sugar ABC transporter ATP-binding protein [Ignavibacteriales bacterium]
MQESPILELCNIRKSFPGVVALDNVDFKLHEGEVHVLLGENGAGKSTLVKIISGASQKESGEIFLYGSKIDIKSPKHARELGIGIIYQELNLIPSLTAAENIFLGRESTDMIGVIDQKSHISSSQKILNELGIDLDCNIPIKNFGIAQKQMIEVAKALSLKTKILIMDEPTSALSKTEIKQLFDAIRKLKEKGVSIIYISHRLEELFEIGDWITVLRDGKWIDTKRIDETSNAELISLMVNRELKELFPKHNSKIGNEILRVENLSIKGSLKKINFSLHCGEILGISGLVGSGRTELARALFGVDKIDSGEIYIKGKLVNIKSPSDAIDNGIGFLTEDRKSQGLVLILTVKENISLANLDSFSKLGVINFKKEKEEAEQYQKSLRIKTPGLNQKAINLSGGNQQKVILAKWLSSKSDILIFDEPTRGIDVGSKVDIYHLMNRLAEQGVAIIMISSELPEILGMSDRILVMHQNEIAGEILENATQEKIMQYAVGT